MQADRSDAGPPPGVGDVAPPEEAARSEAVPEAAAPGEPTREEAPQDESVRDTAGERDPDGEHDIRHPLVREFVTDPTPWSLWPAVALLRWMMAEQGDVGRLVYRSRPSLAFSASEICDVGIGDDLHLVLSSPGLAAPGSALPLPDIARIVADYYRPGGGALAYWLDGLVDRLMQVVEVAEARTNSAFALALGEDVKDAESILRLAGLSAPLRAEPGGVLKDSLGDGSGAQAPGLARLFMCSATAAGLESLVGAFTELPVEVEEFVGLPLPVVDPARVGEPLGGNAIGTQGEVTSGAVNLIVDGTADPGSICWARDPERIDSLAGLCEAYVGGPVPQVRIYLDVVPESIPPAALGGSALGRAPVLGRGDENMRLPIAPAGIPAYESGTPEPAQGTPDR